MYAHADRAETLSKDSVKYDISIEMLLGGN